MESLKRWNKDPGCDSPRDVMRRTIFEAMQPFEESGVAKDKNTHSATGHWGRKSDRDSTQHIQDLKRDAIDRLIRARRHTGELGRDAWEWPLQSIRKYLETNQDAVRVAFVKSSQTTVNDEYGESTIDPITNRRVYKSQTTPKPTATQPAQAPKNDEVFVKGDGEQSQPVKSSKPSIDPKKQLRAIAMKRAASTSASAPTNTKNTTHKVTSKNREPLRRPEVKITDSKRDGYPRIIPIRWEEDSATKASSITPSPLYDELDKFDPQQFDMPSAPLSREQKSTLGVPKTLDPVTEIRTRSKADAKIYEETVGLLTAEKIRSGVLNRADTVNGDEVAQNKQEEPSWDASVERAKEIPQPAIGINEKLTGNYHRDFPEDFSTSWSTAKSSSKSNLLPKSYEKSSEASAAILAEDGAGFSSMDESFPTNASRLEPTINRVGARKTPSPQPIGMDAPPMSDLNQRELLAMRSLYAEDGGDMGSLPGLAKKKSPSSKGSASNGSSSNNAAEYKILAFDYTTQSISTADANSTMLDTSSTVTLSEVLMRLSHPTKFLPYFESLHSEGYEVISGSADVLVFRKTRPGEVHRTATSTRHSPPRMKPTSINPVDMMGKPPGTGNFASPTGFINYESTFGLDENYVKPEPPFRSNLDVKKEEPVYSGSAKWDGSTKKTQKKKRGLGRKVAVGTAWIVGGGYAVGVLTEYFSTGGLDGLGPRGL